MKKKTTEQTSRRAFLSNASLLFGSIIILPRHVLGGKSIKGEHFLAPSDKINVGFIGTGKQGRGLVNSFYQPSEFI